MRSQIRRCIGRTRVMAGGAGSRDLVRAYGGFDIAEGEFSVYSELQVKNGAIAGYLKPLFRGIEVGNDGPGAAEKGLRRRLYEGMVGVAAKILRNRPRGEVATWSRSLVEWIVHGSAAGRWS